MSVDLKDYKGFAVSVEDTGMFVAWKTETRVPGFSSDKPERFKTEEVARAPTFEGLQKKVDALSKQKLGMTVWVQQYEGFQKGTVTSVKEEKRRAYGPADLRARVSFGGHDWGESDVAFLVRDTPENAAIIAQLEDLEREKRAIAKKVEALHKTLDRHKVADMLGGKAEEVKS